MSLLDKYFRNYNFSGHILGFFRFQFSNLTQSEGILLWIAFLAANVAVLFLGAWLFQIFWAWFIPVVIPMLPHTVPYWHAFAATILVVAIALRSKPN